MMRCFIRSSSRPGQATTMSTPDRSAATCRFWGTPPKIVVTLRCWAAAIGSRGGGPLCAQRDGKRERLATASLAAAQHISSSERVGKRFLLYRERGADAARGERFDERFTDAEVDEGLR